MKLPVVAYGHPLLRKKCVEITNDYPELDKLADDMWETMQVSRGCGLAAPQVGKSIRMFIVETETTYNLLDPSDRQNYFAKDDTGIRETFINAKIVHYSDDFWEDEEGCLSIPGMSQKVKRAQEITIEYYNREFRKQTSTFAGYTARVIQHEYDHTDGILYVDRINPLTRRLIDGKLKKISKGQVQTKYTMIFKNT